MADDDRYDQLLQIQQNRQYAAHQRLVQGLENQRQANWQDYCQAIAENDMNGAAFSESEYLRHTRELAEMTGGQVARQQQQPAQQPQQQSGFTTEEQAWIEANPHIWNDPEKRNEAIKAANSLVMRGYRRGSPEYLAGIEHWIGLKDADGGDALPVINDSEMARISTSKYGPTTVEEIRQNKERLALLKQYKLYPMDPTT
jgi:hypothetical protein